MTLQTIRAETAVYGGYVVGRDGKIVFIKGALPGELVEVSLEERRKDYLMASVKNILEPSPLRRKPPCVLFEICGGCQLQFAAYESQVSMKEEIIVDSMRRIGGIEVELAPSLTDAEFHYRHRSRFQVSSKGEIGFYREGTREVIAVEHCPVMVDEINGVLQKLRALDLKGIKEVHVISGDTPVVLVRGNTGEDTVQRMLDSGVSGVAFEKGDSFGKDYITLDLNGLKYTVTPWSFFQSHWSLNRKVIETVTSRLAPLEDKRILDLYAGAGNFSLPLALGAKEVVAVEENGYAVEDGRRNAMLNGIRNCAFIEASVEEGLRGKGGQKVSKLFREAAYDIVVADPPRPGMTDEGLKKIMEMKSGKFLYLSCNPATLARDIRKMKEVYELESLSLIDFFPNTYHVEALAFLTLK